MNNCLRTKEVKLSSISQNNILEKLKTLQLICESELFFSSFQPQISSHVHIEAHRLETTAINHWHYV